MDAIPLLLIFEILCLFQVRGDWIDPYSMDSNAKDKIKGFFQKVPDSSSPDCAHVINCDSDLYLRRMVRLILNNAYLDKKDLVGYFTGHLNIKLSAKEYEFLVHFSQSDESKEEAFKEVNSIFEVAFQKTSFDQYKEMILTFEEELYFLIFNPTTGGLVSACLVLYITYKLLRARFTWKSILKYLIFINYVADFIITYLHIIQDEEINKMVNLKQLGTIPPECDPQKLSWWNYMKTHVESALFENPCKVYYQAIDNRYNYLVAPSKVLTKQFSRIVVEPLGDLGEAFGKFGRRMFTALPWGLNMVIFPIMLVVSCIIIFIVFLFITKPHFKLTLFHLFTIEMGQPVRNEGAHRSIQRINERAIREVGYDAGHRALVEETSNDNSSSYDENQSHPENNIQKQIGANKDENGINQKTLQQEPEPDTNNSTSVDNLGSNVHISDL